MAKIEAAVCVIIVNFNGGALLKRCIAAVAAQTLIPREVVIVDNGSRDGSVKALEPLPEALAGRDRIVVPGRNLGFAAANNLAVRGTSAPWIATLNPDAFPEPDWLAQLMAATERYPGV